jgi:hypothetical protein
MRRPTKRRDGKKPVARIVKLFPDADYGILETRDGQELDFHRDNLLEGRFEHLRGGTGADGLEEPGEQGPRSTAVKLVNTDDDRDRQERGPAG